MRNINVVIHHTDMDGWTSAWVINKHCAKQEQSNVKFFSYTYGQSHAHIDAFLRENIDKIDTLYLVDISLPDAFMREYAGVICWIDHHKSSIAHISELEAAGLVFKHNYSKEFTGDKRVSACELCWQTFFGDTDMPDLVHLAGRYDVWDHRDPRVLELNAFVELTFTNSDTFPPFLSADFQRLEDPVNLIAACARGKEIRMWRAKFAAMDSRRNTRIRNLDGNPIAIVNAAGLSSLYFEAVTEQHPELKMGVFFYYKFNDHNWTICFRSLDTSFSSLELMQKVLHRVYGADVISMGGHPGACGATVADIRPFLDAIEN